jgi:hypothetical protein
MASRFRKLFWTTSRTLKQMKDLADEQSGFYREIGVFPRSATGSGFGAQDYPHLPQDSACKPR